MVQAAGHQPRQPIGQPHRLRMVDAAEHHVRQPLGLIHDRLDQVRMAMAVADRPPGGEGVDDPLSRLEFQPDALGGDHVQRLSSHLHLTVRPRQREVGDPIQCRVGGRAGGFGSPAQFSGMLESHGLRATEEETAGRGRGGTANEG